MILKMWFLISLLPLKAWLVIFVIVFIVIWIMSRKKSTVAKPVMKKSVPIVGRSKSETLAINAFSQILENKGANEKIKIGYRPNFLHNPNSGKNLELDAYYEPWKIGVEYNGIQHYIFPNKFHPDTVEGENAFISTVQRDRMKRILAEENDVCLITIPFHVDSYVKTSDGSYKYKRIADEEKWDKLVTYIENKVDYCLKNY